LKPANNYFKTEISSIILSWTFLLEAKRFKREHVHMPRWAADELKKIRGRTCYVLSVRDGLKAKKRRLLLSRLCPKANNDIERSYAETLAISLYRFPLFLQLDEGVLFELLP
jgi:hypothetical protein